MSTVAWVVVYFFLLLPSAIVGVLLLRRWKQRRDCANGRHRSTHAIYTSVFKLWICDDCDKQVRYTKRSLEKD